MSPDLILNYRIGWWSMSQKDIGMLMGGGGGGHSEPTTNYVQN